MFLQESPHWCWFSSETPDSDPLLAALMDMKTDMYILFSPTGGLGGESWAYPVRSRAELQPDKFWVILELDSELRHFLWQSHFHPPTKKLVSVCANLMTNPSPESGARSHEPPSWLYQWCSLSLLLIFAYRHRRMCFRSSSMRFDNNHMRRRGRKLLLFVYKWRLHIFYIKIMHRYSGVM